MFKRRSTWGTKSTITWFTLVRNWGLRESERVLEVPVTHWIPAAIMGSGLGKNTVWRGDYDIQLFDEGIRQRYRLGSLRYGDLIAIINANTRFGPSYQRGSITIGVIVHGDSTVSGHGPGVTVLLSGPATVLHPVYDAVANLAARFGVRALPPPRNFKPITGRPRARLAWSYPQLPARTRYHLRLDSQPSR
ncbi:MAG: hypothetical protein ACREXT_02505 [Gammaproteobacteria bacterium]